MRIETIPLEKKELRELIIKNWMTHDAMWFYNCLQECGIEKTNKINKGAIKGMAAVEIKRIKKALGVEKIESFDDFRHFFDAVMAIASGDFMKYSYSYTAQNLMHAEWHSCFAYDGMKALGTIDQYECGIMLRINTWLDTLGIKYEIQPLITGCMMHTEGKCYRDYRFFFDK